MDSEGLRVFKPILKLSDLHGFPIHWGTRGFSLNVDLGGKHVALCYGYGSKAYGGQRVWTSFTDVINKVQGGAEIIQVLRKQIRQIGVFTETQKEMKYDFKRKMTDAEITDLMDLLVDLANRIKSNGIMTKF